MSKRFQRINGAQSHGSALLSLPETKNNTDGYWLTCVDPSLQQWDRAISSMIIRSSLGLSFGVIFSVLLFKRRAWPAWVGLGFGAGRAWEEADGMCNL